MIRAPGTMRRPSVVAVAALVITVLATGLVAAVSVGRTPASSVDRRVGALGLASSIEPDTEPSPTTTTSTTAPRPVPTTTVVSTTLPSSRPATTTTVAGKPTTTTTTVAVAVAPRETVVGPAKTATNGTGTWTGVADGITTTLRMEPVNPRVGDTVRFSMTATHATQFCCLTTFYAGDGSMTGASIDPHACPEIHPSTYSEEVDHVYTHAGTFTVEVQPSAGDFCFAPPTFINAQLYVNVVIAPAA